MKQSRTVRCIVSALLYFLVLLFTLSLLVNFLLWVNDYYINISGSIPKGIYRLSPAHEPKRNDLVMVCLPESISRNAFQHGYIFSGKCHGKYAPVGKYVAALAHDIVSIGNDGISVNQVHLSYSRPHNIPRINHLFVVNRILKNSEILLYSPKSNSYDSRYFGIADTSWIIGKIEPVWLIY